MSQVEFVSDRKFTIRLEYCSPGGMHNKVNIAKKIIKIAFPNAEIKCEMVSQAEAFEIYVVTEDGMETLVHSRLKGDGYLDKVGCTKLFRNIQEVI